MTVHFEVQIMDQMTTHWARNSDRCKQEIKIYFPCIPAETSKINYRIPFTYEKLKIYHRK